MWIDVYVEKMHRNKCLSGNCGKRLTFNTWGTLFRITHEKCAYNCSAPSNCLICMCNDLWGITSVRIPVSFARVSAAERGWAFGSRLLKVSLQHSAQERASEASCGAQAFLWSLSRNIQMSLCRAHHPAWEGPFTAGEKWLIKYPPPSSPTIHSQSHNLQLF